MNPESKVKLFTHNDLDGIGCKLLGLLAFPDNIDVTIVKNPQDASEKVDEFIMVGGYHDYDYIFITDISVNEDVANRIDGNNELRGKVTLLDHHTTAEYLNKYSWATVTTVSWDGKTSGTSLFFEYLQNNALLTKGRHIDALSVLVEKIRRYDTWEWKEVYDDKEAGELNQLFYLIGERNFVTKYIAKFINSERFTFREGSWVEMFDNADRAVIDIDNERKLAYIKRKEEQMIIKNLLGYKIGVVFAEQYTSELGNTLSQNHPELKFIVMIDMSGKKVSYRTVHDDINLGKDVASKFGGGGHPKASGSMFSHKIQDLAFKSIFGIGMMSKIRNLLTKK